MIEIISVIDLGGMVPAVLVRTFNEAVTCRGLAESHRSQHTL